MADPDITIEVLKAIRSGEKRYGPTRLPESPWPDPIRVPPPWEGGNGEALPEGVGWADRVGGAERGVEAGR